jgi:ribose transport system ATP-binding protein
VLKIKQVIKTFGGTVALRGVNLEVQPGEFHALLGENGAGKSTLVKIIGGVYAPDKGDLVWENTPIATFSPLMARSLGIGIVHQDSALLPGLSVAANFGLGREPVSPLGWIRWGTVRASLKEQSDRFHVQVPEDLPVRDLSVGQRKLVDIMRVLNDAQKLIILDEPTAAFTVEDTQRLMEILRQIKNSGTAILYVTHRLQEIETIVDRVTVLKDGASAGTLLPEEATPQRIVSLMVGRELGNMYPPPPETLPGQPVLQLRGLGRNHAFHDVNLDVRSGEIVALVGLSGHGAFEAAHSICGDPPAESGALLLDGKPRVNQNPRDSLNHSIGSVTEDRSENVLRVLTVQENISLAAIRGWSFAGWVNRAREKRQVSDLIQLLNIKTKGAEALAESLSGGNQQKMVLGRWLAAGTKILVLVDPTAGVDVGARAEIYKLLRKLAETGSSILIATSDLAEALGLADRIYAFYKGTVQAEFGRQDRDEASVLAAITGHSVGDHPRDEALAAHSRTIADPQPNDLHANGKRSPGTTRRKSKFAVNRSNAPILLMTLLLALAMFFVPNFAGSNNIKNVLVQSVPLLLTAVGQTAVIITGGIDLSIGEVVTLSTIIASGLMPLDHIGIPGAVLACLAAGCAIGAANALMVNRLSLPPFLATLATMFCLQGINLYLRPVPGGAVPESFRWIATLRMGPIPVAALIVLVTMAGLAYHFSRSRFGLQVHALGEDENRSRLSGVSTQKVRLYTYLMAGILASLAGLFLAARTGSGDPKIGSTYVFDSITATVLGGASLAGGIGTLWGALTSGLVLAMLANILNLLGVTTFWQWIIRGVILVSAVAVYSLIDALTSSTPPVFAQMIKNWLLPARSGYPENPQFK